MRPLSWLFRFGTLVVVSSLAIAAITVGVVPRVVDALHAHDAEADHPAALQGVGAAVVRLQRPGPGDRLLRAGEQPADQAGAGSQAGDRGRARRGGQGVLRSQGRQPAQPRAGDPQQRPDRDESPGRLDDHPAGREARVPLRLGDQGRRRPLQAAPGPLRGDAREADVEGPDPPALPQHGLLRQQRLRDPGRGGGVLRQGGQGPLTRRRCVPRRPDPRPVVVRPDHPVGAQPGPLPPVDGAHRRRRA